MKDAAYLQVVNLGHQSLVASSFPKKLQNVMAVTVVVALFWQPQRNQKG
jgi:hypothetical protein